MDSPAGGAANAAGRLSCRVFSVCSKGDTANGVSPSYAEPLSMHLGWVVQMSYRGKSYFIAQEGPDLWKWTVELNDFTHESGVAKSRASAFTSVVLVIDRMARKPSAEASLA
jgi:hypothetical protein